MGEDYGLKVTITRERRKWGIEAEPAQWCFSDSPPAYYALGTTLAKAVAAVWRKVTSGAPSDA